MDGAPPPPLRITPRILRLTAGIAGLLGRVEGLASPLPQPKLRRENRIRTIQGSVAIEGNTLALDQVTAILDGLPVVGSAREIREVQNAIRAYELAPRLDPGSTRALLRAHGVLMKGLAPDAGRWRSSNVGVFRGTHVRHVAPQARWVPELMGRLFDTLRRDRDTPLAVKACVAHYEIEFIHPFSDGNGRIGRLWQHVILLRENPVFGHVPVESIIRRRQAGYYRALAQSDRARGATAFVEFALGATLDALEEFVSALRPRSLTAVERLGRAREHFGRRQFARKDYLALFPALSTATASRDLAQGVRDRLLVSEGDRARAVYRPA